MKMVLAIFCGVLVGFSAIAAESKQPTLTATAADTLQATWPVVLDATDYRVTLYQIASREETVDSDYSGLPSVWPEGWTHLLDDTECYVDTPPKIKMKYCDSWVATGPYPDAITSAISRFRSRSTAADEVAKTYIVIESSTLTSGDADWNFISECALASTVQTYKVEFPFENGIRRLRFSVKYVGNNRDYNNVNIEFGQLTVAYGHRSVQKLSTQETKGNAVDFTGLDHSGCYYVMVVPLFDDDEGTAMQSADFNLAQEYFRPEGPLSVLAFEYGAELTYCETFGCLAGISKATLLRTIPLRGLQCYRNDEKQTELNYTSGTSATKSGCYAFSDTEKSNDSYLFGSLASGDNECSFGYAVTNDYRCKIRHAVITFDSVQRTFKKNSAGYYLEYCVTDGAWELTQGANWTQLKIPTTAPYTVETWTGEGEFWQRGITANLNLKSSFEPGKVLLLRWRHPKTTSGPMMGIDNVRLAFKNPIGLAVRVK